MVMNRAWEIAREAVVNFGGKVRDFFAESLRLAWKEVKIIKNEHLKIKDWFLNKNFSEQEAYHIKCAMLEILEETEKAVKIKAVSDYGKTTFWVPKSVLTTLDDELDDCNSRIKKYDNLISWCKSRGIKGVRKGLKYQTIVAKIKAAELDVPF